MSKSEDDIVKMVSEHLLNVAKSELRQAQEDVRLHSNFMERLEQKRSGIDLSSQMERHKELEEKVKTKEDNLRNLSSTSPVADTSATASAASPSYNSNDSLGSLPSTVSLNAPSTPQQTTPVADVEPRRVQEAFAVNNNLANPEDAAPAQGRTNRRLQEAIAAANNHQEHAGQDAAQPIRAHGRLRDALFAAGPEQLSPADKRARMKEYAESIRGTHEAVPQGTLAAANAVQDAASDEQARRDAHRIAAGTAAANARDHVDGTVPRGTLAGANPMQAAAGDEQARRDAHRIAAGTAAINAREHIDGTVPNGTLDAVYSSRSTGDDEKARREGHRHAAAETAAMAQLLNQGINMFDEARSGRRQEADPTTEASRPSTSRPR